MKQDRGGESANKGIVEQGLCSSRVKPELQVWDQGDGDNKQTAHWYRSCLWVKFKESQEPVAEEGEWQSWI